MVAGVGIDTCKISRIAEVETQFGGRFAARLLTPTELNQKQWNAAALARRWACKEAVAKALGAGIGAALSFQDIEIHYTEAKAPLCTVRGWPGQVRVSVSDDGDMATAIAIWERD